MHRSGGEHSRRKEPVHRPGSSRFGPIRNRNAVHRGQRGGHRLDQTGPRRTDTISYHLEKEHCHYIGMIEHLNDYIVKVRENMNVAPKED